MMAVTPQFGGFYRLNIKRPDNSPVTDRDTLDAVRIQMNNAPADQYPMSELKKSKLGIEQWFAVLMNDSKGDYLAVVTDDINQPATKTAQGHADMARDLESFGEETDIEMAFLSVPKRLEDLTVEDKLDMLRAAPGDESEEELRRMLPNVPKEWFESRLAVVESVKVDNVMNNDLSDARAEFTDNDEDFAAFVAQKFEKEAQRLKMFMPAIDMEWKGRGQRDPFKKGGPNPFGTIVF